MFQQVLLLSDKRNAAIGLPQPQTEPSAPPSTFSFSSLFTWVARPCLFPAHHQLTAAPDRLTSDESFPPPTSSRMRRIPALLEEMSHCAARFPLFPQYLGSRPSIAQRLSDGLEGRGREAELIISVLRTDDYHPKTTSKMS